MKKATSVLTNDIPIAPYGSTDEINDNKYVFR